MVNENILSSFRDPSGFVFFQNGSIYRQVNDIYKDDYNHLINSGLYDILIEAGLLISHEEIDIKYKKSAYAYKIIKPQQIPFISYPSEWCFSQLKDAALSILEIQKRSVNFGMSLKDCSAYNMQFRKGKPVLIDTLSFERYKEGQCWVAYRQFCQHFFAPLALMAYKDIRLNQLFRVYIDGIPLDLASKLLPAYTYLAFPILSHIHIHAKSQKYFAYKNITSASHKMSRLSFLGLIDSLESAVKGMRWQPRGTEWANYYQIANYSAIALQDKKRLVAEYLDKVNPKMVWDLGSNMGLFSRIPGKKGIQTISFDIDPAAVEKNYLECVKNNETVILPLLLDLTNPTSGIGWENKERIPFVERGPADVVMALALLHHLAISNNLPLSRIAEFFCKICDSLIIEFVPKSDCQVKRLLSAREDIFPDYDQNHFETEFEKFFIIQNSAKFDNSERTLYLMKKR